MSEPDTSVPNVARVYDYLLGGTNNYPVDRHTADLACQIAPDAPAVARANRKFLQRVVGFLAAEAGIRQFLDIGSGLPTEGNTHEIAESIAPGARTVYVDNDPLVLGHSRALLGNSRTAVIVQADVRRPADILNSAEVRGHLDFDEPVGLLLLAIVHHLNDHEEPSGIVRELREGMCQGSHLAVSHFYNPGSARPDVAAQARMAEKLFNEKFGTGRWRSRAEILGYFGDWQMLDPGVVPLPEWRPIPDDLTYQSKNYYGAYAYPALTYHSFVGGVALKP